MREKLQILMNAENLTGSRLAEYLGIQPSSISHIMSGRNKPSLDFVQKILQRYPRINPDWLLLDSEQMYRTQSSEPSPTSSSETLFDEPTLAHEPSVQNDVQATDTTSISSTVPNAPHSAMDVAGCFAAPDGRSVKRVIVMFDDRTFESYEPRR